MAFKVLVFCAIVAVARAGLLAQAPIAYSGYASPAFAGYASPLAYRAPLAYAAPAKIAVAAPLAKVAVADEYDPNPQYSYAYDIQDALTGDSKNQHESRNGDVVQGQYQLTDSDGYRRIVDYTADPHNGFNAVVRREPLGVKVAKVVAPVAYAQPIAKIGAYAAPAYAAYH